MNEQSARVFFVRSPLLMYQRAVVVAQAGRQRQRAAQLELALTVQRAVPGLAFAGRQADVFEPLFTPLEAGGEEAAARGLG